MSIISETSGDIGRLQRAIETLEKSSTSVSGVTRDWQGVLGNARKEVQHFSTDLERYTVTQMRMERGMQTSGQSVMQLNRNLKELNKETTLSITQTQELFQAFERGYVGIRKLDVIKDTIKNINKMTLSSEETTRVTNSLIQAQSKFVGLQERLNRGGGMTLTERMTLDPNVVRDLDALTASQNKLLATNTKQQEYLRSMEEMEKKWKDSWMNIQKATMPVVTIISQSVSALTDTLKPAIDMLEKLTSSKTGALAVTGVAGLLAGKSLLRGIGGKGGGAGGAAGRMMGLGGIGASGPGSVGGNLMVAGNLIISGGMIGGGGGPGGRPGPWISNTGGGGGGGGGNPPPVSNWAKAKGFAGKMIKSPWAIAGAGLVGGIGGGMLETASHDENGVLKRGTKNAAMSIGGSALSMGGQGAAMGAMVGGPWGAAIGGAIGAIAGLTSSISELNDQTKKEVNSRQILNAEKIDEAKQVEANKQISRAVSGNDPQAINTIANQIMEKNKSSFNAMQAKWDAAKDDKDKQEELRPEYEAAARRAGRSVDSEGNVGGATTESTEVANADALRQATQMFVDGMDAAITEMNTVNELLQNGITGLQTMASLESEFYLNAKGASEAIMAQNGLLDKQIEANDVIVNKQKQGLEMAKQELGTAEKKLSEAKTIEDKETALKDIKTANLNVAAREAEVARALADSETKRVQRLKNIQEAMMQNYKVQQTQVDAEKNWYEARNQLISQMRMGMGGTYQSQVDMLKVGQKQIQVTAMGLEDQKKVAQEYAAEARATAGTAKGQAASKAAKQASLQVTKMETELMQKQSDYLEKFNQLREGYIDRLAEDSFGGADVEFDPTKASGLVNFMGTGSERGHYMVGGVGTGGGREEITSQMGRSGERQFGDSYHKVQYAQSREMDQRTGMEINRNGTPTWQSTLRMGGNVAPDVSDVPGSAGANTTYNGAGLSANSGATGMNAGGVFISAAGAMGQSPAALQGGTTGSYDASGGYTGTSSAGPSGEMIVTAQTVNGNLVINGNVVVNGEMVGGTIAPNKTTENSAPSGFGGSGAPLPVGPSGFGGDGGFGTGAPSGFGGKSPLKASQPSASPLRPSRPISGAQYGGAGWDGINPDGIGAQMGSAMRHTVGWAKDKLELAGGAAKILFEGDEMSNAMGAYGKYHDGRIPTGGGSKSARQFFGQQGIGPGEEMALIRKDEAILPSEFHNILNPTSGEGIGGGRSYFGGGGGGGSTNVNVTATCPSCMSSIAKESINQATGNDINRFESGVS